MKYKEFTRMFKFCIVGGIGMCINTFFIWLLTDIMHIFYIISAVIAIEIAIFIQFMLNDRWTFREKQTIGVRQFIIRMTKSNTWRAGGIALNLTVLYVLTEHAHFYYLVSNIFGILCAFLLNYILESRLTWGV
ncbi:MAG: GtrA family protein [Canidatus Methanoxibalbensis ujae]|nr:GtrA family protein [Candidatus Methanoxibalbensis ujae]MCW7077744.1 GtrA family protein [Candidatus Methanoxibalbensis ujae]